MRLLKTDHLFELVDSTDRIALKNDLKMKKEWTDEKLLKIGKWYEKFRTGNIVGKKDEKVWNEVWIENVKLWKRKTSVREKNLKKRNRKIMLRK